MTHNSGNNFHFYLRFKGKTKNTRGEQLYETNNRIFENMGHLVYGKC